MSIFETPTQQFILAACLLYDREHGYDTDCPAFTRLQAVIHEYTGEKPSVGGLEQVLHEIEERGHIESRNLPLWDGDRIVQPRDTDYGQTLTRHLEINEQDINAALGLV